MEYPRICPLQLAIHVVQNRRAGEKKSHWDKTNKENYHFKLCMSFIVVLKEYSHLSLLFVSVKKRDLDSRLQQTDLYHVTKLSISY